MAIAPTCNLIIKMDKVAAKNILLNQLGLRRKQWHLLMVQWYMDNYRMISSIPTPRETLVTIINTKVLKLDDHIYVKCVN